jgi:hypothetical protein
LKRFREQLIRLNRDEEGSSLVFAAITLFSLTLMIMYVYQMGIVTANRMQIQNAADAAAYSAAQVEANALNSIGQINDAMTYLNYLMLRFTVDAIVYDTLHAFESHSTPGATGPTGYVLMGGGSAPYEGPQRFLHAKGNAQDTLPNGLSPLDNGKEWVQDLHYAARTIMRATPDMVKLTAARVAAYNGAQFIAISEDIDLAFKDFTAAGGPAVGDGFAERAAGTFSESMYKRYGRTEAPVWQIEKVTPSVDAGTAAGVQHLPNSGGGWFDPTQGRASRGDYSQVRLCWNKDDWTHEGDGQHGFMLPYGKFREGAPNGHWHRSHSHWHYDGLTFTELGPHGGISGGTDQPGGHYQPDDDDPTIHNEATDLLFFGPFAAHHYVDPCPTCRAMTFSATASWSEVRKTIRDASNLTGAHSLTYGRVFPRPLLIRQPLLQSGITVVAWSPASGIGDTFPESDWGMIAVASGSIGYQVPGGGVLPLTALATPESTYSGTLGTTTYTGTTGANAAPTIRVLQAGGGGTDTEFRNFFYSDDKSMGVRFGARLVPIAGVNTFHPDLNSGSGLGDLLDGARWKDVGNVLAPGNVAAPLGVTTAKPRANPTDPARGTLRDVVRVNSQASLDKFWH